MASFVGGFAIACSLLFLLLGSIVLCELRGPAKAGALEKLLTKTEEAILSPILSLPFSDAACFIEEYAGLIGAMYDTEEFDREKAKAIIADYLKPVGLQSEVAKMLYLSLRELVPILALEPVPDAVFNAFQLRIVQRCNGRKLQGIDDEQTDSEEIELVGDEVFDQGEEEFGAEVVDEEIISGEGDVEGLEGSSGDFLTEDVDALMKEEEALEDVEEYVEAVAEEEVFSGGYDSPIEDVFEVDAEEEVLSLPNVDSETAVKEAEAAAAPLVIVGGDEVKTLEQVEELLVAVSPENLSALYDSLRANGDESLRSFLDTAVGGEVDFTNPFGIFGDDGAGPSRSIIGNRSCSFLSNIDNHCFVVKYAGFVGASWGTRTFDEQKAKFILDTFVPIPELVGTVATVMCLGANDIMPLFAGDQTITPAAMASSQVLVLYVRS
eukprot:GHVS01072312.1.p1 GENE.GHVS01072312.1~~GHVS01072312.1.p1  ORF type:complete len:437 (+),score=96.46 GHVS01072312.1:414-1724(+)